MNIDNIKLANRLRDHTIYLSQHIGERHLWRDGSLVRSADYIESQLLQAGYEPARQEYKAYRQTVANIIAAKKGSKQETIVIGAHYDSVPGSPGADDNASGVAGILELARLTANAPSRYSLVFAAFVNEESPTFGSDLMGSMQYAKSLKERRKNILLMISLEMIGFFRKDKPQGYPVGLMRRFFPHNADFIAVVGDFGSSKYVFRLARYIRRFGGMKASALVAPRQFGGIERSDQKAFWHYGFRALMVTDTAGFRNPNYHRETDTADTLDFEMSARVVCGIHGALRHMR